MNGAFTLKTPTDLLGKLEVDYSALQRNRGDPYLAYNFFVTAEHMLDWVYPGNANRGKRTAERNSEILLQVCSHLAAGAKHFTVEAKHHNSVSAPGKRRRWNPLAGPLSSPQLTPGGIPVLTIKLEGEAEESIGPSVEVLRLAQMVIEYWRNHKELNKGTVT